MTGTGALTEKTWVPLGTAVAVVIVVIGACGTVFSWRSADRDMLSLFQTTTASQLIGIDRKVDDLRHRIDLFEQSVNAGMLDRFRKSDMRLWLYEARVNYPGLPDVK